MPDKHFKINGLSAEEVLLARSRYGRNALNFKKENGILEAIFSLLKEPMVLLLFLAATIYLISGNTGDAVFLAAAIVLVSAISLYQDSRSRNALAQLKDLSQPHCKVIRDGEVQEINSDELVIGDSMMIEEGSPVAADGAIVHSNDFSVDESILTGESLAVFKDADAQDNAVFRGTTVASGLAIATVTAVGNETKLGKIGKSLESIGEEKTPLEIQISSFVKKMVVAGALVFAIVWAINYLSSRDLMDSLLKALTLAMSILPEEIPVAFTTFMALGSWRLMKMGIVVKQMKTVETLGSATVICTDKTGTLTENKMSLAKLYVFPENSICAPEEARAEAALSLIRMAMFASEPIPFDPMELALHQAYAQAFPADERPLFHMVREYPLAGKPPLMTHIFENKNGQRVIAAKGAPEALIRSSKLTEADKKQVETALRELTGTGYRVLGVGEATLSGADYPDSQTAFEFQFKGLVAFYDPPKHNIQAVLEDFYAAGIQVKIVTGDNAATTRAIAKQIGFRGQEMAVSGETLMHQSDKELQEIVAETQVFTRMFPEAKLRIIDALKANNEIVAMTGDGVNDGPALKSAHIGIAMGKKGTEIAKQAASLVLLEDDLSKMVDAVAMGRKIYSNLKKAIQYVISIHIPIILTVFLPLALGWIYPNIFSPVHVIFLELIMGPTCSIIYENEPMEQNTMLQKPRPFTSTFFNWKELATSVLQGLMITVGVLLAYQYAVQQGLGEAATRTMVFSALISANIFLTLVNRSFYYSILTTLRYKNNLVPLVIFATLIISGLLIYVGPLARFFEFEALQGIHLGVGIGLGFLSVIWYEVVKWRARLKRKTHFQEPVIVNA
jgi:P-type Ca2+ transporter type 2C